MLLCWSCIFTGDLLHWIIHWIWFRFGMLYVLHPPSALGALIVPPKAAIAMVVPRPVFARGVLGSPGADAPRRLLWSRRILCYSLVLLVLRRLLWSSGGPVGRPAVILCYSPVLLGHHEDPPIMKCEATVIIGFPDQLLKRISITHGSNEVFSLHCFHYVAKPFPRACNYELF